MKREAPFAFWHNKKIQMDVKIAQVVVNLPMGSHFDYIIPENLRDRICVGQRVYVPFGRRSMVGCVIGLKPKSSFGRLRPVLALLDNGPLLDRRTLKLAEVFAGYYGCSLGEAVMTFLPTALRKKITTAFQALEFPEIGQDKAAPIIVCHDPGGKQREPVLISQIKETLDRGQGVMILVPEVHRIPIFQELLSRQVQEPVCLLDKEMTQNKELEQWQPLRQGKSRMVLGTRSAVFAPVKNLGLITVLDEDHSSYKQEQSPCYHVRDVVQMRRDLCGCSLLFISSAPSAELWHLAKKNKDAKFLSFPEPRLSPLQAIDMSNYKPGQKGSVSFPLQNAVTQTLARGGRTVLILNRRGFHTLTRCSHCGFAMDCDRCGVHLTFLYSQKKLVCRLCGAQKDPPSLCPSCGRAYLKSAGAGIEKMESELSRVFPQAQVARFDRDSKTVSSTANIVIATQAVMRVLEQMSVQTIGILDFDAELNRFDFRSAQKAFSWLIRLRELAQEKVFVQTQWPDHYCLKAAKEMNFEKFYREELRLRRELGFPPFRHLISAGLRGTREQEVFDQAHNLYENLLKAKPKDIDIIDPQPAHPPKLRGKYRFTVMLKGKTVKTILKFLKKVMASAKRKKGVVVMIDVDP